MANDGVRALLHLLHESFEGRGAHSLLTNLRSVPAALWAESPAGGERTVAEIVEHVGACKYMYENHAFGDASSRWDEAPVSMPADPAGVNEWLRSGQRRLVASVEAVGGQN